MCSAMLQQVRYTNDHDLRFQCSKNLDMYSDYMKRIRFADAGFEILYMYSDYVKRIRFAVAGLVIFTYEY